MSPSNIRLSLRQFLHPFGVGGEKEIGIRRNVQGSTMLEPLTAVVIISLTLTMAGVSFSNMMRNHTIVMDHQIKEAIQELKSKEKHLLTYKSKSASYELFDIELTYVAYDGTPGLKQQTFTALNKEGKRLLTKHFLVADE